MSGVSTVVEVHRSGTETAPSPRSRASAFRDILRELVELPQIRGGVLVAPDGFVIAADLPEGVEEEALAALAATLGRHLELGASRLGRGAFSSAMFAADDGMLFLGGSPVGFLVILCAADVNVTVVRAALRRAGEAIRSAWETGERRFSA
jgi:predicted regulator of Ras-like GTPase activity (Roadblock/LC7/MglB family)